MSNFKGAVVRFQGPASGVPHDVRPTPLAGEGEPSGSLPPAGNSGDVLVSDGSSFSAAPPAAAKSGFTAAVTGAALVSANDGDVWNLTAVALRNWTTDGAGTFTCADAGEYAVHVLLHEGNNASLHGWLEHNTSPVVELSVPPLQSASFSWRLAIGAGDTLALVSGDTPGQLAGSSALGLRNLFYVERLS